MSEIFKVGEIVILKNDPTNTDEWLEIYDGEEVEIVQGVAWCVFNDDTTGFAYEIRTPDGNVIYAFPHELRRRKPPTTGEQSILALFHGVPQRDPVPA